MPHVTMTFEEIDRTFRPKVVRYLASFVDGDEAADLAQVTMIKVNEHLAEFRGDSSLDTWIHAIARNVALDRLRERSRETVPIEGDDAADDEETSVPPQLQTVSTEGGSIRTEMSACVREFVDRLPADYRTVLVLADIEGMTNREIAAATGLAPGTVKIRLHRARARLAADLRAGCTIARDGDDDIDCDRRPLQPRK